MWLRNSNINCSFRVHTKLWDTRSLANPLPLSTVFTIKHILKHGLPDEANRDPSSIWSDNWIENPVAFLLSTSLRKRHILLLLSTSHLHWKGGADMNYWALTMDWMPKPTVNPYCRNNHYFTGGELKKLPKVLQPTRIGISTALFPHGNVWPNNTKQYGIVHSVSISECSRVSKPNTLESSNNSYKKAIKLGNRHKGKRHKEQGYTLLTVHK